MAIDVDQAGAVRLLVDQMVFPDLVVESARLTHQRSWRLRSCSLCALSNGFPEQGKVARRRTSKQRPELPKLREKRTLQRGFQVPHARGSTGAALVTDDALDRLH